MIKKDTGFQIFGHIVMIFLSLLVICPLLLLFMSSISSESSIIQNGYTFWPKELDFSAYAYLFREGSIFRSYGITILVTAVGTLLSVMITTMLAFTLSRPYLPGKKIISFYVLFTMLFSGGLIPSYMMWTGIFHVKNTIFALIFPSLLCNGFSVMITRTYFQNNIPPELLESARTDGLSEMGIFFKIVLPLSVPIIATIGFMNALTYWNDWTNSLYYITNKSLLGIQALLNNLLTDAQYLSMAMDSSMAAGGQLALPMLTTRLAIAVVGMLPMAVLYPFFQKYYTQGLMIGAVKG